MSPIQSPGVLATVCLPWDHTFTLKADVFSRHIIRHLDWGIRRLYLFGTAGEGYAVTTAQFRQAAKIFAEVTEGKADLRQLGVISLSLPLIWERIEIGRSLGINSFQLSLPCWAKLNDDELTAYFSGICDRYPDCTFLFYNVARGLRTLTPAELGRLAQRHSNLTSVKWAVRLSENDYTEIREQASHLTHYFTDIAYCEARLHDVPASLLVALGAINPIVSHELFALGQQRNDDVRLHQLMAELHIHRRIISSLNAPRAHVDGALDKLFCRIHDPEFPLRLLPPYEGICEQDFQRYASEIVEQLPMFSGGRLQPVSNGVL